MTEYKNHEYKGDGFTHHDNDDCVMTDYKNELEQILERFAKFYANTERTLSPPFATAKQKLNYFNNHDYELYEATEAIEALLSKRELEARVDENEQMMDYFETASTNSLTERRSNERLTRLVRH